MRFPCDFGALVSLNRQNTTVNPTCTAAKSGKPVNINVSIVDILNLVVKYETNSNNGSMGKLDTSK
jgi:hypothetical protein